MNWNQPKCDECFAVENPGRTPVRLKGPEPETCSTCGNTTFSGIYVRQHPDEVNYPAADDD